MSSLLFPIADDVYSMYNRVIDVLGSGSDLEYECETTTLFTISNLIHVKERVKKVIGEFDGNPHFWTTLDGQIIDLSVEQFGYKFEYPVSKNRLELYVENESIRVDSEVIEDAINISLSSELI